MGKRSHGKWPTKHPMKYFSIKEVHSRRIKTQKNSWIFCPCSTSVFFALWKIWLLSLGKHISPILCGRSLFKRLPNWHSNSFIFNPFFVGGKIVQFPKFSTIKVSFLFCERENGSKYLNYSVKFSTDGESRLDRKK